jgi:hypothetical protein
LLHLQVSRTQQRSSRKGDLLDVSANYVQQDSAITTSTFMLLYSYRGGPVVTQRTSTDESGDRSVALRRDSLEAVQ